MIDRVKDKEEPDIIELDEDIYVCKKKHEMAIVWTAISFGIFEN
jgi:hypothetical protein